MDKIQIRTKTFTDDPSAPDGILMNTAAYISTSLAIVQLAADTLTATVRDHSLEVVPYAAGGLLLAASDGIVLAGRLAAAGLDTEKYGTEIDYYHDSALFGRFRLESVARTGRFEYRLNCVSDIGLLISSYHYGGIYTGITAGALIADIIGGIVPYSIDATLAATPLYGWLPKATRRDSLLHVLFAIGGQIRKTAPGTISIAPYVNTTPYEITDSEFYEGGSVAGGSPASEVDLTEHSFLALPTDESATLFDGEAAAELLTTPKGLSVAGVLVEFEEPMHDLEVTGAEILESDANYAVLSRSPAAVLTGRRYSHTQRSVSRRRRTSGVPNVVNSSDCALVNLFNSELVADRLMAYYGSAKTVTADLVVTTQKPGDAVMFRDPFDEPTSGYIGSLELTMSRILKGRAELISGFVPPGSGNYYTHVILLASGASWTVPAECRGKIRVVLIGGGQGGESGAAGSPGIQGTTSGNTTSGGVGSLSAGKGGSGGAKGSGGSGGNIFIITLEAAPGMVFSTSFGVGGAGGVCSGPANTPGSAGSATTFGGYSSADGSPSADGYAELFSSAAYATPGISGVTDGGDGAGRNAAQTTLTVEGQTYTSGTGGSGDSDHGTNPDGVAWSGSAYGGFGGGPAYAANGKNGHDGHVSENNGWGYVDPGSGGDGADATIPGAEGATYGAGGQGGSGGGGGGGNGAGSHSKTNGLDTISATGGAGGLGSAGGDGADGCIIIYY